MDKYVIATIHPFVLGQEINIYINNECVRIVECTVNNMCDIISKVCDEYDINTVHFYGGQLYALKFKDDLVANKFSKRKIEVHIH